MAAKIYLNYAVLHEPFNAAWFEESIAKIPESWQEKVLKFNLVDDQARSLMGRLLLLDAMSHYEIPTSHLLLAYGLKGRPYLAGIPTFDFNITHSHRLVACASSCHTQVGVDAEHIRPISFGNLRSALSADQWREVEQSSNPVDSFFSLWTRMEAAIKADGRAFYAPLDQINFGSAKAILDGNVFHLLKLQLAEGYASHVAYLGEDTAEVQITEMAV